MKNLKEIILVIIFFFCNISNAHAYIDPGTGSIILQAILALIAGTAVTISIWWGNLKAFIRKIFRSEKKENKTDTKV